MLKRLPKRLQEEEDENEETEIVGGSGDEQGSEEGSEEYDEEDDDELPPVIKPTKQQQLQSAKQQQLSTGIYSNKQRVLVIASRGITARYRHLLEDLKNLIPHHKKDNKLDSKSDINVVNEIAEMKSCNNILYLETRKHTDLYMYVGATPNGPSAKFHVVNTHTTDELKLTGNCMLGSRPLLNFDVKFDSNPHWQLLKSLLTNTFNTPKGHPKSKPFVDRVMSFFIVKNSIWIRNFQIIDKSEKKEDINLVEIGPRMVLIPIRIFSGSLGGATLYQNSSYISPNEERSSYKKSKGDRFTERVDHKRKKIEMVISNKPDIDPLAGTRIFR